jgi:hypothetical protein
MLLMCRATVFSLMRSSSAIARLLFPLVAKAVPDPIRLGECFVRGGDLAATDGSQRDGQQQIAAFHAIVVAVVNEPACLGQPPRCAGTLGFRPPKREPERAPGRADRLALIEEGLMCPGHRGGGVGISAEQVARHRESFEVSRLEG